MSRSYNEAVLRIRWEIAATTRFKYGNKRVIAKQTAVRFVEWPISFCGKKEKDLKYTLILSFTHDMDNLLGQ